MSNQSINSINSKDPNDSEDQVEIYEDDNAYILNKNTEQSRNDEDNTKEVLENPDSDSRHSVSNQEIPKKVFTNEPSERSDFGPSLNSQQITIESRHSRLHFSLPKLQK